MNANRFASFHQAIWDATIYTEDFTTIGSNFMDIDKFIIQKEDCNTFQTNTKESLIRTILKTV
jgi:hypothetical protein